MVMKLQSLLPSLCRWATVLGSFLLASAGLCSETLYVPASSSTPVSSSPLTAGASYRIEVSGTYVFAGNGVTADAEFIYPLDGTVFEFHPGGFTATNDICDLIVNGKAVHWLGSGDGLRWAPHTCSQDHVYRLRITGTGTPFTFAIADQTPFGPGYYQDNGGGLTVTITEVPATEMNGLFLFIR